MTKCDKKKQKKTLNNNIEIAYFEHLSKQAKFAVREAFKLQKLLKSPTPNRHLEDFILRGVFKSNKGPKIAKKGHFFGKN